MYSRKSNRSPIPPHLPEHYNGWAFRPQPPPPPSVDRPPMPPKMPPHRPPDPPRPVLPPPHCEEPPKKDVPCDAPLHADPMPPPFLPPSLGHLFGGSDLLRATGLDFEELLIIGLILLLGGNDTDSELPLLLALLLFCG